ncbi:C3H1-type domain-containing protein [Mycena chlorophos]|uniref:C3H1-type domain-containing protein n=1 Tax=Mycena chlorophos TaxID=658473 RepID=A0A8H6WDQ5_MYCCL|nr:C3H1-type domain-containing protein [Mycena chlorophos]
MTTKDAPWRVKTRPCPFYQQGRCVFEQSCNFVHDISIRPAAAATTSSSSSNSLPELLDVLRDVLDPAEDTISMAQEYGVSPHIPGEGWTLVTDTKDKDALLSPVSLDVNLARISTIKNNDSIDSGYASDMSFVSPQPLPSTLGLLSSPFGSPTSRMGPPAMGIGIGASRLFSHSPFSPGLVSPLGSAREDSPDLDSPSTVRRSTGVFDVEDEEDSDAQYATAQWNMSNTQLSEPPSRFSSSTLDDSDVHLHPDHLHPGSRFSSTTIAPSDDGSDSDSEEPPEDATAQLAYLQNDTINTLYDVYMSPEDRVVEVAAAEEPERGRSIRARVFTPPPRDPKPKFEPEVTSTPSDRSSSKRRASRVRSMMPPPGPRSVFSVSPDTPPRPLSSMSTRNRVFHRPTETASPESISVPLSATGSGNGKVPFGFRPQSRNSTFQPVSASASQTTFPTHARNSTFGPMSASATQTTFTTSPKGYVRKRRISRSAAPPIRDSMASSSRSSFLQESETVMVKGLKSLRLSKVLTAPPSSFSFPDSQSPQRTPTHVSTSSLSAQSTRSAPIRTHTASSSISARSSSSRSGMHHKPQDTLHIAFADPEPEPTNDHVNHRRHHSRAYSRTVPMPMPEPALRSAPADWQNPAEDEEGNTIRRRVGAAVPPIQIPPTRATSPTRAASALGFTHPATSTPLPTRLLFAIASDDPEAVRHVLESGDVGAEEMAAVGPEGKSAVRYFVERAAEEHARRSSALIHRSFFRPLARVRYELVGQDRALEQLFRVLSMHSQRLAVLPVVVLLCGPSGHGKSLLARRFGALLDVPTHTVNMTTLRAAHDLWTALSMGPDDEPSSCTLAEFLINNEGKRCAVILDEIEKVEEKTLWSLLMPWESGRCSFEANSRHVDVRNVVWLGTSNVGTDVIMEHHAKRPRPDELMSREEYVQLMKLVREPVSRQMGASILSRVTTVLPFVPFTRAERVAICAEAFQTLGSDALVGVGVDLDGLIGEVLDGDALYVEEEGARSLYRAVANRLLDL